MADGRTRQAYGDARFATAGEVSRNFGQWQDQAAQGPVVVTHHGRPRVVMVSAQVFEGLQEPAPDSWGGDNGAAKVAALLNHTTEGFYATDAALMITEVNRVFEDFAGLGAAQMIGRSWSELFPAADRSIAGEQLRRVLRTGEETEFEMISTVRAGRILTVRAFPYDGGVGVLFINRSEERALAERLRGAAAVSAALSMLGDVGVVELNLRGAIVSASAAFERLTGFSGPALSRARLIDILTPKSKVAASAALEQVFADGRPLQTRSVLLRRQGEELPVRIGLSRIDDPHANGGLMAVIAPA